MYVCVCVCVCMRARVRERGLIPLWVRSDFFPDRQVDWDGEKECFQQFSHECSSFYSLQHDPFLLDSMEAEEQIASSSVTTGGDGGGGASHRQPTGSTSDGQARGEDALDNSGETQVWSSADIFLILLI